jgi:hypothetical protein
MQAARLSQSQIHHRMRPEVRQLMRNAIPTGPLPIGMHMRRSSTAAAQRKRRHTRNTRTCGCPPPATPSHTPPPLTTNEAETSVQMRTLKTRKLWSSLCAPLVPSAPRVAQLLLQTLHLQPRCSQSAPPQRRAAWFKRRKPPRTRALPRA